MIFYLPSSAADSAYRMVFETDGHRVTSIMAGNWPFTFEVEGCS